ncbi:similar to Saccharomyces cerevisiae YJR141W Essential protein of unknown function [Maudiozyma saulgeensis]|uniref:Ubiquitin-conjugating enzyme E2C-binding protein n=1 Tax=Maudiozyma saulgeensis TaxID=1789683 RepID=A0A1X7R9V7_9SACH|nr:similar to Saccharomyces cerevisiae YJR141W Essential protein of unknown function [Kazachstania saulgeensis]
MRSFVEFLSRIGCILVIIEDVREVKLLQVSQENIYIEFKNVNSDLIQTTHISLPGKFTIPDTNVTFQSSKQPVFNLRLKAICENHIQLSGFNDEMQEKWCKKELSQLSFFTFNCINCNNTIISKDNFSRLNDMPSEHWEELMDYWHCHKPSINDTNQLNTDLYSGKFKHTLRPIRTELLLGGSYFLCLPESLELQITMNNNDKDNKEICCKKCRHVLGEPTKDELIKLYKWNLKLNKNNKDYETFDPVDDILMSLLTFAKDQSGRYILISYNQTRLLLWLFNTGLRISTSKSHIMTNANKILYTMNNELITTAKQTHNMEEITVQQAPFQKCISQLQKSNEALPISLQKFDEWSVSYLQLYNHPN